jgi:ubiquinone/menaquinone biosynthesis C-methylase UbiE
MTGWCWRRRATPWPSCESWSRTYSWLLPLYDPFTRLMGIQAAHQRLADQAGLQSARRVLEIGCGTGNLALLVKRIGPQLEVVGPIPTPRR